MKAENKGQLVRGVVVCEFNTGGNITFNPKEVEERGNVIAYTPWHRHDDDLSILEKQLEELIKVYGSFAGCKGTAATYEYKAYEN